MNDLQLLEKLKLLFACFVMFSLTIETFAQKAEVYLPLCDQLGNSNICKKKADTLFTIIEKSKAFDWDDEDNNCEDRANALSLILDSWNIPNGKAWIFQGSTFDNKQFKGTLGGYRYHVASCILIKNNDRIDTLVIDPLMDKAKPLTIQEWAGLIATNPMNLYFVTSNKHYQQREVSATPNWKPRDEYFDDTIDGLTRYNNFSFFTRLRTKRYLKKRAIVLNEFNSLTKAIPDNLNKITCN